MSRIVWQFSPAILIMVGALLAATGGFWQSWRQANFNKLIQAKNDEIITLQQNNLSTITGGDSFAEMGIQVPDTASGSVAIPMFIHHGKFPIYDVEARIVDLDEMERVRQLPDHTQFVAALSGITLNIGSLTPGFARGTGTVLQHPSGKDFNYNVFFVARNGSWIQEFRMKWNGKGWSIANRISGLSEGKQLFSRVTEDYPRDASGAVVSNKTPNNSTEQQK